MGHHLTSSGAFKSDKHPDLPQNKIILSFKDRAARYALRKYCEHCEDDELRRDLWAALNAYEQELEHGNADQHDLPLV